MKIRDVVASDTVNKGDYIIICNSTNVIVLTLQSAVGNNDTYYIKNIGAGTVTITPTSPDLIDNSVSYDLLQYEATVIMDYKVNAWLLL